VLVAGIKTVNFLSTTINNLYILKFIVIILSFLHNCLYSRRGNTKASGREAAELAMEGVVEGDGMAEGNDNMNNILPSTSSSISTNAPDMATSSSTTSNTNPSSSGTQATGGGVNCNVLKSVYYEP